MLGLVSGLWLTSQRKERDGVLNNLFSVEFDFQISIMLKCMHTQAYFIVNNECMGLCDELPLWTWPKPKFASLMCMIIHISSYTLNMKSNERDL